MNIGSLKITAKQDGGILDIPWPLNRAPFCQQQTQKSRPDDLYKDRNRGRWRGYRLANKATVKPINDRSVIAVILQRLMSGFRIVKRIKTQQSLTVPSLNSTSAFQMHRNIFKLFNIKNVKFERLWVKLNLEKSYRRKFHIYSSLNILLFSKERQLHCKNKSRQKMQRKRNIFSPKLTS